MRLAFVALTCLAACSSNDASRVDVTLTFDGTVSDSEIARAKTLVFHASGDESGTFPVAIGRAPMRVERVVYRPKSTTRSLELEVDALDENDEVVASGPSGTLSLAGHDAVPTPIQLSAPTAPDLGASDAAPPLDADVAADGGVPTDASMPGPDMAAFASPSFVNSAFSSSSIGANVGSISVKVPTSTRKGTLLLAMIGGINTTDTSPVLFDTPAGWTSLTSRSDPTSPSATAAWFWRFATDSEPATYTFDRSSIDGPTLGYIAAYAGTVAPDSNGPFDSPLTTANASSNVAQQFPVTPPHDYELLVLLGIAPDDFYEESWGQPYSMIQLQGTPIQSAYVPCSGTCDNVSRNSSLMHADSRSLLLLVGLRSASP